MFISKTCEVISANIFVYGDKKLVFESITLGTEFEKIITEKNKKSYIGHNISLRFVHLVSFYTELISTKLVKIFTNKFRSFLFHKISFHLSRSSWFEYIS